MNISVKTKQKCTFTHQLHRFNRRYYYVQVPAIVYTYQRTEYFEVQITSESASQPSVEFTI